MKLSGDLEADARRIEDYELCDEHQKKGDELLRLQKQLTAMMADIALEDSLHASLEQLQTPSDIALLLCCHPAKRIKRTDGVSSTRGFCLLELLRRSESHLWLSVESAAVARTRAADLSAISFEVTVLRALGVSLEDLVSCGYSLPDLWALRTPTSFKQCNIGHELSTATNSGSESCSMCGSKTDSAAMPMYQCQPCDVFICTSCDSKLPLGFDLMGIRSAGLSNVVDSIPSYYRTRPTEPSQCTHA